MEPLREDPVLADLIDEHGVLEIKPAEDPFERLVVSIINQQLSGASAAAIRDRVFERVDVTPRAMLEADPDNLRDAGLSAQKIEYIRNVARAFEEDGLSRETFSDMDDDAVIEELTDIRGVGVWTAKMFLIFCLGREDVFPVEDLGIRKGMSILYDLDHRDAMVEKAEEWRPYRSYASRYVWRAVD
ncbi:MAG: DNA-3-methyladenine glycosylase 2 family protein [Halobacteriales archaeon]|nr:DNA-3-methyladenine glycosylase 2 family protein [Halobacteriales archaeon]